MAEWVARGRAHQSEGRAADALPCFRRAVREDSTSPVPLFHLGEVLWQLGMPAEAASAWHRSAQLAHDFVPPRQALSEAAMLHGDYATAQVMARQVADVAPQDVRNAAVAAAADAVLGDPGALGRSAVLLEREPSLVQVPSLAHAYAEALPAADPAARASFLRVVAARMDMVPPELLAVLAEHGAPMPAGLVARPWTWADGEALRRIAVAVHGTDPTLAIGLASTHAALTAAQTTTPVPLLFPRRTAGRALRVAWIAPVPAAPMWSAWMAMLRTTTMPEGAEHVVLMAESVEVARAALATTPLEGAAVLAMSMPADIDTARALAARDCDVLIDAAGLTIVTGALLALRPARTILALACGAPEHRPPLVDARVTDGSELSVMLRQLDAATGDSGNATVADLMTRWDAAVALHREGDLASASTAYAEILREQPGSAPAWQLSGDVAHATGDLAQARTAFDRALAMAPDFIEARISSAELALESGDPERAATLARDGLARASRDVGLWRMLGRAELGRREAGLAVDAFSRALRVTPASADLHFQHGVALQMAGDAQGAARAWQRALTFDPDLVAADFNLGTLFANTGNVDAAIAAFAQVLRVVPTHVAAYKSLGEALFATGRMDAWFANFDRFCANCPKALPMAIQALEVGMHRADFTLLEATLDGLRKEIFVAADVVELVDCLEELLYLLLFFDIEPELSMTLANRYDAAAQRVYGRPAPPTIARRPGPLRVGYLSADLRNHVMGKMVWQAVTHHDREQFQLFFYSMSAERDEWTERFASIAKGFTVVAELDDAAAAARILADDLDLLVDLSTHTRGARPGILARKPARVQVTHVASAGALGLAAIDFKLTDHFADVPENGAFQVERLLPMEGCVYPYRQVAPAIVHPFDRATLGIATNAIVIGAFVNPLKLSRRCLALWRDVLQHAPSAVLAFSPANPAQRESYVRLARAVGIDTARLLFIPQGRDDAESQSRYHLVDFVLDTMPFGGVNGTIEALAMQVPVVTLVGRRHGERTSYSILANLGVHETVAQSGREYVEIARRLAEEPSFRLTVRARIAAGLAHSPLTDMPQHTRNLEAAYLHAMSAAPSSPSALD